MWLFFIISSLLCSSIYSINLPIVRYYYCRSSSSRSIRQGTENIEIIIDCIQCMGWIQPGYTVPLQMGALKTKKESCDDGNVWNITWMYNSQHSVRLYYASVHINWGNSLKDLWFALHGVVEMLARLSHCCCRYIFIGSEVVSFFESK